MDGMQTVIILTFIITGIWDVVLRGMSESCESPSKECMFNFIRYLQPYFKRHTLLGAALIAGFIGATSQLIILNLHELPSSSTTLVTFMMISFLVSGLYGFVIKGSNLFPHLVETYYKKLGPYKSMYHDGVSGLIVQTTVLIVYFLFFK
jgi:hypothetical protein